MPRAKLTYRWKENVILWIVRTFLHTLFKSVIMNYYSMLFRTHPHLHHRLSPPPFRR
jgi:hypothetical protein